VVAEHGEEALLRPDLIYKNADGTAIGGRVTFSNAQGDAQAQERKRLRDESGSSIAPTNSAVEPLRDNSNATDVRPAKAARTEQIPDSESHHAQMHNQDGVEKADNDDDDDDGMCFRTWTDAKQLWKLGTQTQTIEHYGPWLNSYHGCCCKHNGLSRSLLESPSTHDTHILFVIMERHSVHEACRLTGYVCLLIDLHPIFYDTHTKSCINTHKHTPAHHRFRRRRIAKHYAFFQSGIQLGHPSGSHPFKRYTSTESEKKIDWN